MAPLPDPPPEGTLGPRPDPARPARTPPTRPPSPLRSSGPPPDAASTGPDSRFGRYLRTDKLGAGGMGEVWKAWDAELSRWVALKFLKGDETDEIRRFQREARTAAGLSHPHIAAIYEIGESAGRHFIAMQFVDGVTLKKIPRSDPRLLVQLVRDAARAVHAAHRQGIVHRDLKPDNLMVTRPEKPSTARFDPLRARDHHLFVMDFGLARPAGRGEMTVSGAVVGTPSFMPPEQARGDRVDARADVYSLGATLYDVLTGRPPFKAPNVYEVLRKVQEEEPLRPRAVDPRIDADLETILLKCLDKQPSRRYATAEKLADELDRWLLEEPIEARPAGALTRLARRARRHAAGVIASASVLLVAALLGVPILRGQWIVRQSRLQDENALRESGRRLSEARRRLEAGEAAEARRLARSVIDDFAAGARKGLPHPIVEARLVLGLAGLHLQDIVAPLDLAEVSSGVSSDARPEEREAAARALLELGRLARQRGDLDRAALAFRTSMARHPSAPSASSARLELARTLEAAGHPAAARAEYAALEDVDEARNARKFLDAILPVAEFEVPSGDIAIGPVDDDPGAEIVVYGNDGRVHLFRIGAAGPENRFRSDAVPGGVVAPRLFVVDVDGDGRPEVVTSWGDPAGQVGELRAWFWRKDRLEPGPPVAIQSWVAFVVPVDLDGDGRPEVAAGTGYFQRQILFFRIESSGEWSHLGTYASHSEAQFRSDPLHAVAGDFDGRPGQDLLVSLGPWNRWQLVLLSRDSSGRIEERPALEARARFPWFAALPDGRLALISTLAELDQPERRKRFIQQGLALHPNGLHLLSIRSGRGEIESTPLPGSVPAGGRQEFVGGALMHVEGAPWAVVTELVQRGRELRGRIVLKHLGARALPPRLLAEDPQGSVLQVGDLDGDGDPEILFALSTSGHVQRLRVHGCPGPTPAPAPEAPVPPRGTAGDDLLAFGFPREAARAFERDGSFLGLGMAQSTLGDWEAAAASFDRVQGEHRVEALRRCETCLRRLRDWAAVARTLAELETTDTLNRDSVRERLREAREALQLSERARPDWLAGLPGFSCSNPHLVVRAGETGPLEITQPRGADHHLGVPFRYGGGPLRLEWEMRISRLDWDSRCIVGFWGDDRIYLHLGSGGGSDNPDLFAALRAEAGEDLGHDQTGFGTFKIGFGEWHRVVVEYTPSDRRIVLEIHQGGGNRVILETRAPRALRRGIYWLGKPELSRTTTPSPGTAVYQLRGVNILAADTATCLIENRPSDALGKLAAAHGAWVGGRTEEAEALYEQALSSPDPSLRVHALFYRGCMRRAQGREGEGNQDLQQAAALNPEEFTRLKSLQLQPESH